MRVCYSAVTGYTAQGQKAFLVEESLFYSRSMGISLIFIEGRFINAHRDIYGDWAALSC